MKSNYKLKDPSKQYIKVVEQASSFYGLFSRKKKLREIEVLKNKLNNGDFEVDELASGFILIAYKYEEINDYESAAFYFNKGLNLGKDVLFPYNPYLKRVLKTFLKASRKDLYDYWRSDFLKRSLYDKKFNKLMKL
ncbi:hypothetical protein [Lysinibacillus sp. NPDC093688]|uniref:hypothetical protein n=1 Tax=Lysinibacillus sp. NPDC093688 TaxID=3390577 RepID=UPI003CFCFE33